MKQFLPVVKSYLWILQVLLWLGVLIAECYVFVKTNWEIHPWLKGSGFLIMGIISVICIVSYRFSRSPDPKNGDSIGWLEFRAFFLWGFIITDILMVFVVEKWLVETSTLTHLW